MTPEQFRRVRLLFDELIAIPEAERRAHLDRVCSDDAEVHREVLALIEANVTGDVSVIERSQGRLSAATEVQTRDRLLGAQIGPYRIRAVLGAGGMGTVYEAEHTRTNQVVALKLIRPGVTSPELLRRFELELQTLARLEHPGIARIYHADTADTGGGPQPYFAMELVRGRNLIEFAVAGKLSIRQRLELAARIADAVQYAHQQGVIHRDLKPGNIFVTADGQPKILDFGVARATDSDVHSTTLQTDIGQLIGTLPYMSPEQASGDPAQIDTRSDVYALGVVTYELLTGRLPYLLQKQLIFEAVRIIREEEPTRLSSLNKTLRGDVETIVDKSLEKDKERRYASANALAADIRRYLGDEPITARPPSATYQISKFARRNRAVVAACGIIFLTALLFGVVSFWLLLSEQQARADADTNAARAVAADRDKLAKLISARLQAGQLALERGNWSTALENFDSAEELGYADTVEIDLLRLPAWDALSDEQAITSAVNRLSQVSDGPNLGRALLCQGEYRTLEQSGLEEGLELIRAARVAGLPPDEDSYAAGVLPETLPEAAAHFETAITLGSRHMYRAIGNAGFCYLAMGRFSDADIKFGTLATLYPQDPLARVVHAASYAVRGNRPEAERLLEIARPRLKEADYLASKGVLDFVLESVAEVVGTDTDASLSRFKSLELPARFEEPYAAIRTTLRTFDVDTDFGRRLRHTLRPALANSWGRATSVIFSIAVFKLPVTASTVETARLALAANPEGVTALIYGLMLREDGRNAEAIEILMQAITLPAIVDIRDYALEFSLLSVADLYTSEKGLDYPALLKSAELERVLTAIRAGNFRTRFAPWNSYCDFMCQVGAPDLARREVQARLVSSPTDPSLLAKLARIEYSSSAYENVARIAEQALQLDPGNSEAKRVLSDCQARLGQRPVTQDHEPTLR